MPIPVYLVDGSAYIYRAYHAITPLTNSKGLATHATLGFINTLLRVIREKSPTHMAVAFDMKGPTFRHKIYSNYKANRPTMPDDLSCQIPYIHALVAAHNIPILKEEGVEADDLIASAAKVLRKQGYEAIVVSGDKDLLQLVAEGITAWEPMKDVIMDQEFIRQKYDIAPELLLDFFALIGDTSDNIPGVAGVGPKTAAKLLAEHGSLDNLLANLDRLKKSKLKDNLIAHQEMALLSRTLIDLKDDLEVPQTLDGYQVGPPHTSELQRLYKELEFNKLLKETGPAEQFDQSSFQLLATVAELVKVTTEIAKSPFLVLDTETTSLDPLDAELVGISLTISPDKAWYIPIAHRDEDDTLMANQFKLAEVQQHLGPLLANKAMAKIGHNIKYDMRILAHHDMNLAGPLFDTMIASYILEPSRRSHKLDDLSLEILDRGMTSFSEVTAKDKRPNAFAYVGLQQARDYSCEDAAATLLLWKEFHPQLDKIGCWNLFTEVEMALVPILAEMEENGILADVDVLKRLSGEFALLINDLERSIHVLAGEEFNINSPKQLGTILFEKLALPQGKKTKTGYSTDVKVLEDLAAYHDLPAAVLNYRSLTKLKSTYIDALQEQIHPKTGRIHTSYNQSVAATGRLSSSNPNLQNIPIRSEEGQRIRAAFVAPAGSFFLAADYSQIDLRVLAHYSQDEALLKAFNSGQDIHNQTAGEIFRVSPLLITSQMRRVAKSINFGIVYGMSAFGLSNQLRIGRKEAQTFIDRYFEHFKGVKKYMEEMVIQAREDGFVTTLLGRRRNLPEINSSNKTRREFAERTAINSPIQGTAADIIKLATIKSHESLNNKKMAAKLLLQIHDELVFEVPTAEFDATAALVKEAMESVLKLDVPLLVNISKGANLANT
ncbi:MAG: DNA polymerase I [Proteobacteria bacterium]|nr:DNA polymerase I [Pseudomonadota bacterium]MBU1639853.1 DNA polymerase I [Pseudomonadota bacterium]